MHKIAVIGLGYVGLPVAKAFAEHYPVIAFDTDVSKVARLAETVTPEAVGDVAVASRSICYTAVAADLQAANVYIVCVPTPIDAMKYPDLSLLIEATKTVAHFLQAGDLVIYESTVYPGATEQVCVPLLEKISSLRFSKDFHVGYSPERINPGDQQHTLDKVIKVVSASSPEALQTVTQLYQRIVKVGVYQAPNIKTAEAAKVIENTQRDLNIALMNELAIIFNKMNINTHEVIKAAKTKWNFLAFEPGLVGGHCIGVDPYYLTYQAQNVGHNPQVILAGRNINDSMGQYIATQTVKKMLAVGNSIRQAKVAVLGLTFKQNCDDIRNSKVVDIIKELQEYGVQCLVHDPVADQQQAWKLYHIQLQQWHEIHDVNAVILAVSHDCFKAYSLEQMLSKFAQKPLIMDVKNIIDAKAAQALGIELWQL